MLGFLVMHAEIEKKMFAQVCIWIHMNIRIFEYSSMWRACGIQFMLPVSEITNIFHATNVWSIVPKCWCFKGQVQHDIVGLFEYTWIFEYSNMLLVACGTQFMLPVSPTIVDCHCGSCLWHDNNKRTKIRVIANAHLTSRFRMQNMHNYWEFLNNILSYSELTTFRRWISYLTINYFNVRYKLL